MDLDVTKENRLRLLLDSGADVSLLKSEKLIGTVTFEPREKRKIKSVDGSVTETHGAIETRIREGNIEVPFTFQLVSKQVDIACDGILGRDFLQKTQAKICYETGTLTFRHKNVEVKKKLLSGTKGKGQLIERHRRVETITLPRRSEVIVKLPVAAGTSVTEGLLERKEILEGVYMAGSLTKVIDGHVLTSVLNTRDEEVEVEKQVAELEEIVEGEEGQEEHTQKRGMKSRDEEVWGQLRTEHLNPEERKSLSKICSDYPDVFYLPGDQLSSTNAIKHTIRLVPGTSAINTRPYRLPESQKEEIDKQVTKLLKEGVIEESDSPWNSPILVVPKKEGKKGDKRWRLVVDFRKLNEKTVGDAYPLPDITEILDQLGQSKYFSCLDMVMGYHQIELEEEDIEKTAFSTKNGHWAYRRLPFGLKTAPATFQRMMNTVLSGLTGTRCFAFLDDIVVYARSLAEHDQKLREILERLRRYKLKLQPEKCEFLRKEVNYLGHVITENGVRPDPSKIHAVEKIQPPTTVKQLKSFLGMAGYYRKFIQNFSRIATPLHLLLKKDAIFEWTEAQEQAFQKLKSKLIAQPVLQYPDFTREFVVTTDASNDGLGAVLSQGEVGRDLPVAYASRSLNKAESHYSTSEKELLAIVWALKYFRPYLYGRRFKIVTDHKPLVWIMNVKDPGSRLLRWRIKLEEFDYEVIYKKGSLNTNADTLSRISSLKGERPDVKLDEKTKKQILYECHDAPLGGHRGMNKTYKAIKARYSWTNMRKEVENYVKKCRSCQMNKMSKPRKRAPMEITTTAEVPFEKCSLDIVGPMPETERGNRYILTFQDDLSKYVIAVPISHQDAETVAKGFVTHVVLKYGTPHTVLTDQGTNFLSDVFKNTCKLLKIKKIQSTAFHPETNGGLERSHRVLAEYLRHYIREDQSDWDDWVPFAMFTYNTTEHTATGYTPFELVFGRKSILPSTLADNPSPQYTYNDYVAELRSRLQTAHQIAKDNLLGSKVKSKECYDKGTEKLELRVGDKVLLHDETVRRGRSKKLSAQWIGPYEVVALDRVNVTIKRGKGTQTVHVNRVKPFY